MKINGAMPYYHISEYFDIGYAKCGQEIFASRNTIKMFIMFGVLLNLMIQSNLPLLIPLRYVKGILSKLKRETAIQRKFFVFFDIDDNVAIRREVYYQAKLLIFA